MTKPYSVDHLVLPVEVIGVAVKRLVSLGFTVAPEALHPFGTQNACVFFADGTYLEPLAIADPAKYNASIEGVMCSPAGMWPSGNGTGRRVFGSCRQD